MGRSIHPSLLSLLLPNPNPNPNPNTARVTAHPQVEHGRERDALLDEHLVRGPLEGARLTRAVAQRALLVGVSEVRFGRVRARVRSRLRVSSA